MRGNILALLLTTATDPQASTTSYTTTADRCALTTWLQMPMGRRPPDAGQMRLADQNMFSMMNKLLLQMRAKLTWNFPLMGGKLLQQITGNRCQRQCRKQLWGNMSNN